MSTENEVCGDQSETKPDPDCPPNPNHPPLDDEGPHLVIFEQAKKAALLSATQGIAEAADELYSPEPEKSKKRDEVFKKYKTDTAIAPEPGGPVRVKFEKAIGIFESAMADLLCQDKSTSGEIQARTIRDDKTKNTRFDNWLFEQLDAPRKWCAPKNEKGYWKPLHPPFKPLYGLFFRRKQVGARLDGTLGHRELALREARNKTKRWADAFKAWSDPGRSIDNTIGSSIGDLEKINADILSNNNVDYAIYRLLFEVAPRLIQVSPADRPLEPDVGEAITRLANALVDFPERQDALQPGSNRNYRSVYLIPVSKDDKDDPKPLQNAREKVLEKWTKSADKLAAADAALALRKDDAQSLKTHFDTLVQTEAKLVQELLAPPTS